MVSDENVANATANAPGSLLPILSINPLLKALRPSHVDVPEVGAAEIALAVSNIFTNQLSTGMYVHIVRIMTSSDSIASPSSSPPLQPLPNRPRATSRCLSTMRKCYARCSRASGH